MADINLLVLNVGNSRLGVAVFIGGDLQYVTRVPHGNRGDWPGVIAEAWKRIEGKENAAVAGASVNPPLVEPVEQAVHQATGKKVEWIGKDIDLPVKVLTDHPEKTGVDRVLNVAAAYEQMGKACVVVDAGSAITVDVCNDKGEFLGGAIAPGVSLQLRALHEWTGALPKVDFDVPVGALGRSTEQAILHGVYHGARGMVKELVENYATDMGHWPDIVVTGGDGEKLFGGWELVHAVSLDLTFYGVALAYANHHIKHGS